MRNPAREWHRPSAVGARGAESLVISRKSALLTNAIALLDKLGMVVRTDTGTFNDAAPETRRINRILVKLSSLLVFVHKGTFWIAVGVCHLASSVAFALPLSLAQAQAQTQLAKQRPYVIRRANIICPDGMALMLEEGTAHYGAYVPCELLDLYQEFMETGQETNAERMLVAPTGASHSASERAESAYLKSQKAKQESKPKRKE